MRFSILGPLTVRDDHARPVPIGGARLRTLLVLLLVEPGRSVGTERLIEGIWDGGTPAAAPNALQALVSRLRRALGGSVPITGDSAGYRAEIPRDRIDLWVFEDLVATARTARGDGDLPAAERAYDSALSLWRGEALADLEGTGLAEGLTTRITGLRRSAVVEHLDLALDLGRHNEVLPEIEALAAREPLRERPVELLMRALAGVGRQADALAAFDALRRKLIGELGVDPSAHIRALHVRLLRGELEPASPAPSPRARAARLPRSLSSFIGRDEELRTALDALDHQRLVTLTGPGGAGKTRLSLEIGARFARTHTAPAGGGEVHFLELAPLSGGAEVPTSLLTVLGLRERVVMGLHAGTASVLVDPMDRVIEGIGTRAMLLILDNCEHLADAIAPVAERLLADCPGLRILATSREPLAVPGERLFPLPSLALPPEGIGAADAMDFPAVRLFADRAAAAVPGFTVDAGNVAHVVRICRELDGLPLALELAAARARAVVLPQLAERLSDRFRLLTSESRSAMPRHRTLEAVVDWSWDLLDDAERVLLRRLSAFSGGALLEAVEEVCADGPEGRVHGRDVWSVLFALVDKSLVTASTSGVDETATRYRTLETVRAYGARRLAESGEETAVRAAHARAVLRLWSASGPGMRGPGQRRWVPRLRAEHDNLTTALRFSVEQRDAALCLDLNQAALWFWQMGDGWNEAGRWAAEALELAGDRPPEGRLVAYIESLYFVASCDSTGAATVAGLDRALALLAEAGVEPESHHSLVTLRVHRAMIKGGDETERELARLETLPESADPWLRATTRHFRGLLALYSGRGAAAAGDLESSAAEYRALGDGWRRSEVLATLADLAELTDLDECVRLLAEGAELAESMDTSLSGLFHGRLALVHAAKGDHARAAALLDELIPITREPHQLTLLRLAEAEVARLRGDLGAADTALAELRAELATVEPLIHEMLEPMWRAVAAAVRMDTGDWPAARASLARAWRRSQVHRNATQLALLLEEMARLALGEGDAGRAAWLFGGGESVRGLPNRVGNRVDRLRRELRARLGEAEFAARYGEGARTDRAEVLTRAGAWLGVEPAADGPWGSATGDPDTGRP